jgi:hypothetical protein
MINLVKIIEKGSLRWIGQNYEGLFPDKTVIAGKSIQSISEAINLPCYRFKKINQNNLFIAHDSSMIFYVYVNPKYTSYRKAFAEVIGGIPNGYHVDHILSRNLAKYFQYNYVLLCVIPGLVNSRHGYYEKIKVQFSDSVPDICYSDDRIYDKILARNPTARRPKENIISGYKPKSIVNYGLTLKQKGIWNSAFGFDMVDMKSLIDNTSIIK